MKRLARTVLALTLPFLAVPALGSPAEAAGGGAPQAPSVEQVARIFPVFRDGKAESTTSKVARLTDGCTDGRQYTGSRARFVTYTGAGDTVDTLDEPLVAVGAMSFRSVRDAKEVTATYPDAIADCSANADTGEVEVTTKVRKIRFRLGDDRSGYTVTSTVMGQRVVQHVLAARSGKKVTFAVVLAFRGAIPAAKAVRLTRLGLRAAG